jgi:hypothetical protein
VFLGNVSSYSGTTLTLNIATSRASFTSADTLKFWTWVIAG